MTRHQAAAMEERKTNSLDEETCLNSSISLSDDVIVPKGLNGVMEVSEEELSLSSLESETPMERTPASRPSSSLSLASTKSSRIPRFSRSASLNEKRPRSLCFTHPKCDESPSPWRIPGRISVPATPTLPRRSLPAFGNSYVSPYSRKVIAAERKSQCPWRPSEATSEDEDTFSEKSFGSVSSTRSLDVGVGLGAGSGFWGTKRRSRNILHCSHAHAHDPNDYLTPTQRAAKKIRELQSSLKKARNDVLERDVQISSLTRDLVELRMSQSEGGRATNPPSETGEESHSEGNPLPPLFPPGCLTPDSEDNLSKGKMDDARGKKSSRGSIPERTHPRGGGDTETSRYSPTDASLGGDSDSGDLNRSLADSGHYEDLPSPCMSSRDSLDSGLPSVRRLLTSLLQSFERRDKGGMGVWAAVGAAEEGLRAEWTRREEELKANHMEEYHELKERHNDKVEMLLAKLSDANLKYFELRPQFDKAEEAVRELEKERERLKGELRECEVRQQKVYLQMYIKGQEAAKLEAEDKNPRAVNPPSEDDSSPRPSRTTLEPEGKSQSGMVLSLMTQLAQSEDEIQKLKMRKEDSPHPARPSSRGRRDDIDPAITLQFLKSAIYYFLTDKENSHRHLRAIESILGYSSVEKGNITRSYRA